MDFEFDESKSKSNAQKHGIDFVSAQNFWNDQLRLIVAARSQDEPRFAIIAAHQGKIWMAIYALREDRIRIISARRSRHGEEEGYHNS